jgi:hypothetical protein
MGLAVSGLAALPCRYRCENASVYGQATRTPQVGACMSYYPTSIHKLKIISGKK